MSRHCAPSPDRAAGRCQPAPLFTVTAAALLLAGAAVFALPATAAPAPADAEGDLGYQLPPQTIVDMIDAPRTPNVTFGPDPEIAFLVEPRSLISVAELAEEELRLAGLRFEPRVHAPSRMNYSAGIRLLHPSDGSQKEIAGLPDDLRFLWLRWSPDGQRASFVHMTDEGGELWMIDTASARAERLLGSDLHLVASIAPDWLDAETLVATVVPHGQVEAPARPRVPKGPVVQDNDGEKAGARTYQDLLENAYDEALFEHHLRSQIVLVDLDGKVEKVGKPGLYWEVAGSPDGRFLLVETLHRPFSYLVPVSRFPLLSQVWNRQGKVVKELYDRPLQESIPLAFGSVATGPRSFSWRDDAPATLVWVEALDGGDAGAESELRDRVLMSAAPFDGEPRVLADLDVRYGGTMWARDDLALVLGWWWKTRQQKTWAVAPGHLDRAPRLVEDRSWEDRYNDPGTPTMTTNEYGRRVLQTSADGQSIFRIGSGASPEGDRPFLDRVSLETGEAERLFRSEAPHFERPFRVLDDEGERVLTRRESREEVPNYYVRNLADGSETQVTQFTHPTPQLLGVQKELVTFDRKDGVQLSGTLYTPPGYDAERDGPLPMVMWAYPNEFKSADAASQVSGSPHSFDRVGWWSQLFWLTQGYAVLDDPTMPIVGEGEDEPNDTFREQLVSSAEAAIDEMVKRGVAKRGHVAIGGHSYGAFMTANLLAHSDLFAAGIARSGAYNRTLTPFGFQSEERTFWEAPEIYFSMSPFMHADKVDEPILLIHGAADNNPGTFPIQSERFFNALKSHGAVARLVMLPEESHGYRGRESILHMLWETHRWLEKYVDFDVEVEQIDGQVQELPAAAGGR